jgi:C-terminal processing protease CtpA/Prc
MLNLDMIGRLSPDKNLIVYGTGTSSIWKKLVDSLNKPYAFKITKNDEGYGPSDQTSFYSKSIPVLFFFTGIHADYHRPTDDADKINYSGEDSVLHFVHDIAASIYSNPAKPDYINVPRKPGDRSGGWRVYVGTIPDFAYQGDGFKISGASEGGPAQKAGLKAGDIILKFGSTPVGNIYDFTNALKNYVPGDLVVIKVKRGEEIININVELGAR